MRPTGSSVGRPLKSQAAAVRSRHGGRRLWCHHRAPQRRRRIGQCVTASGFTVGAIAVVNAVARRPSAKGRTSGRARARWVRSSAVWASRRRWRRGPEIAHQGRSPPSTTIALVVTDAILTKPRPSARHDGRRRLARAIRPAHAPWTATRYSRSLRCRSPCATSCTTSPTSASRRPIASPGDRARRLRGHGVALPRCLAGVEGPLLSSCRQGPRDMSRMRLMVACLIALTLLLLLGWQAQREHLVRACLDSGGAWTGAPAAPCASARSCSATCTGREAASLKQGVPSGANGLDVALLPLCPRSRRTAGISNLPIVTVGIGRSAISRLIVVVRLN